MNTFWILMEQIELFIVYLVIGMILVRTGVLSDKGLDWIARVVMKLSLPTMIFVNVVSQVDRTALVQSLSIIGLAVTASILLFGLGVALTKLFHVEGDRSQIYRAMTMFGIYGNPDHYQHFPGTGHAVCIRIYHCGSAGDVDGRSETDLPEWKRKV